MAARPPAPVNVVASDDEVGQVTITWDAVVDPGVVGYAIYRALNDDPSNHGTIIDITPDLISIDTGGTVGRTYWYSVQTRGTGLCSALSSKNDGTSLAAPVALPGAPQNLTVVIDP